VSQFELKQSDIPINMSNAIRIHLCVNTSTIDSYVCFFYWFRTNIWYI